MEQRIKIKHDGPRGWAGIAASAFDPNKHERYDAKDPRFGSGQKADAAADDLKARAKALGIKGAHLMKDETLRERIAEAEG
jgi:hypothetical protein